MKVALAHATGFSAGAWDPVVQGLTDHDVRRWNFHGHGGTAAPESPVSWWTFGFQTVAETEPGMVGVGHSMGGAALLMAELLDPGRFAGLVLVEPIVFETGDEAMIDRLASRAERRRFQFASRSEARERLGSTGVFSRWDPAAMEGYLRDGLVGAEHGVVLACAPAVEAAIYRSSFTHGVWDRLGEITTPTIVLAGAESDTYQPGELAGLAEQLVDARSRVIDDAGHLLPMERPSVVVDAVHELIATL